MKKPLSCSSTIVIISALFYIISNVNVILCDEKYEQVKLPGGVIGPESIDFDCNGQGPYVGVSDGRILKWQTSSLSWTDFAVTSPNRQKKICDGSTDLEKEPTCGRPLGLKFNKRTCELYIADAYYGLVAVGPDGGLARKLVATAEGLPLRFTNALDIDTNTGHVYFTDSSLVFQRRDYILAVLGRDKTGRLLKYDPESKQVTVIYKGLAFPNGVALSKNNSFLLLAESNKLQIQRFWLHNNNDGPEVFAQLTRFPDNIKRNSNGEFWVALNSARGRIAKVMRKETYNMLMGDPVGIKFDESGKVVKMLDGNGGQALESVSEVEENGGCLYLGSSMKPYLGIIKL